MKEGARLDQRRGVIVTKDVPSRVHPKAKALADELHIDLKTIVGTGEDGMVLVRDVREQYSKIVPSKE